MRAPYNRPKGTSKPPKTPRKRQSLIGNEMHSPASATALECATFIFLIGNEFRLQNAHFRLIFRTRTTRARRSVDAPEIHPQPESRPRCGRGPILIGPYKSTGRAQALFCGAGEVLFLLEQGVLAFEAPPVAGQVAILADDAMARHNDGDRVGGAGASDRANGSGLADGAGDLGVRARGAVGDAAKLVPDAALERGGLHVKRQIDMRLLAAQVAQDFAHPLA